MLLQEIFEATKNANKEIITYLKNSLQEIDFSYENIGFGGDISSKIDLICESIFIKHLLCFGDILSEESGLIKSTSKFKIENSKFIIDPLDGSDNFLSNLPYYGSSVAFQIDEKTIFSMITNFVNGQMIYKINNELHCDGISNERIGIFERCYANPNICAKINLLNFKFRSPGAVALSLANARFYKFVLFYGDSREFDMKAALHINEDLNIFQNKQFLLICHDRKTFEIIKNLIS